MQSSWRVISIENKGRSKIIIECENCGHRKEPDKNYSLKEITLNNFPEDCPGCKESVINHHIEEGVAGIL